jgi:hypothetical protein
MIPPDTVNGLYGYGFYLATQPWMDDPYYGSIVLIIWEPAGTREPPQKLWSIGPGSGGTIRTVARTHDDLYDVRVTWHMLLPSTVDLEIDVYKLAAEMVQRYKHYAQESNQSSKGE